ncbi:MAG TPA: aspartate kinase [Lentimicrobium sp.]|nr:aspartate kinase [Lentimicrobium sp.]
MKVFKFGGASVKDADAVRNVQKIIGRFIDEDLLIVFSAMGKTTNALEKVTEAWIKHNPEVIDLLKTLTDFHYSIAEELKIDKKVLNNRINTLHDILLTEPPTFYDEAYDMIVSFGELFSTDIISSFLNASNVVDAREVIITDETHRNGSVKWDQTKKNILHAVSRLRAGKPALIISQGFIGSTGNGKPVTLGREGSDFSAAIFAWALEAEEMIIWKDVPGVLNADPRYFDDTVKLEKMSYRDAIELAYYGASVIHPKTIQPLQNSEIPLYVRSFYDPGQTGTLIYSFEEREHGDQIPSFIIKHDQILMSISPRDFSFIAEGNLHGIFGSLSQLGIHINMMQLSAISFSIVIDNISEKLESLLINLKEDYRIRYNSGLELITIRYYDQGTIDKIVGSRKVLLEQKSRTTVQLVVE